MPTMAYEYLWCDKQGSSVGGLTRAAGGAEEQFGHIKDVLSQFCLCAGKCLLPQFRVVGMGQHLTGLLGVVFTEKPALRPM